MPNQNAIIDFNHNQWEIPTTSPSLSSGDVHVWQADLLSHSKDISGFWEMLSTTEKERADRFYFPKDREQFIVAKGITRLLLSKYLATPPEQIVFTFNTYGKPQLAISHSIQFNISHAGGLGLFAFTLDSPIGVDVEKINQEIEIKKIAKRFFSPVETQKILSLPTHQQVDAFFSCWTRKEAFIKGHGEGLSLPLDQFEVSILDTEPVEILAINWVPTAIENWNLIKISLEKSWKAAVAIEGQVKKLELFSYDTTLFQLLIE